MTPVRAAITVVDAFIEASVDVPVGADVLVRSAAGEWYIAYRLGPVHDGDGKVVRISGDGIWPTDELLSAIEEVGADNLELEWRVRPEQASGSIVGVVVGGVIVAGLVAALVWMFVRA